MNRREWLGASAVLGVAGLGLGATRQSAHAADAASAGGATAAVAAQPPPPLPAPQSGSIDVAFLISEGAVVIDFCGPWEVFESAAVLGRRDAAFTLYTVAETSAAVTASGGMKIVPNFTFTSAPPPKVIVIPAQRGAGEAALAWIRDATRATDLTMSVCTGAFVLAKTGLLNGKSATTHHSAYTQFAMQFPDVQLRRGARFVEAGNLASAGGLTSGIDLSLRVVERYFGRATALRTADYLEYQGLGWTDPDSNHSYRARRISTDAHPLCPVCDMDVDPASAPKSVYRGRSYYFCMPEHKVAFDQAPQRFLEAS